MGGAGRAGSLRAGFEAATRYIETISNFKFVGGIGTVCVASGSRPRVKRGAKYGFLLLRLRSGQVSQE